MIYKTVLFDFHNVLSRSYIYDGAEESCPGIRKFVEKEIFAAGSDLPNRWMRGELSSADINRLISERLGIDCGVVAGLQQDSVRKMDLETRLLELAQRLRKDRVKTAIVSDNVDIFSEVTVKHFGLDSIFDAVINSAEHGLLKSDAEGRLFDIALERLGESDYARTLLIDDSLTVKPVFEKKGGTVFTYSTYEEFEPWMLANLGGAGAYILP